MPRFTNKDTIFASIDIYGSDLNMITTSNIMTRIPLPVSNRLQLADANVFQGLIFAGFRYVLAFLFFLYSYFIQGLSIWNYWLDINVSMFWWIVSLTPFIYEDVSSNGDTQMYPLNLSKGSILSRVYNSPTSLGNYAVSQSMRTVTHPRTRIVIRKSLRNYLKPKHMAFVLELNVLPIKQPPEVPIAYLDAEKKLILPDKKDVGRVLTQRAEWASAHHVHKAAETIRILYESAKIIAWAACSKINIITIHEVNGYAWSDLAQLSNLVQEEMKNLTRDKYMVNDFIKIFDLDSNSEVSVLNSGSEVDGTQLSQMEPTPDVRSSVETVGGEPISTHHAITGEMNKFSSNLTVLLTSGVNVNFRSGIKNEIKNSVRSIFGVSIESDFIVAPEDCVDGYIEPEVLVKYSGPRQQTGSLNGFPLVNQMERPLIIEYSTQPVSFKAIRLAIEKFDSLVR